MELAKNLAQWRDQSPEQWVALANRSLPPIAAAALVVLLAIQAAGLTWQLLEPRGAQDAVPPAVPAPAAGRSGGALTTSLDRLAGWRPFGEPPAVDPDAIPAAEILDAPETTLPLTLHGVVEVHGGGAELPARGTLVVPEAGSAIIAVGRDQQQFYRTGEEIEGANGATLHSVYVDRVIIDRSGRLETLFRPDRATDLGGGIQLNSRLSPSTVQPRTPQDDLSNVQPSAPQDELSTQAALVESIGNVASTLGRVMNIAPQMEGGQAIGYRLQPTGEAGAEAFARIGLEPGDVLTEVNGIRLDDVRNTGQVFQALSESSQASVTIRRNGVDQAMVIDMNQLQQLVESLQ